MWTKKRAQNFTLWFGQYKGVKFAELLKTPAGVDYLHWLALRAEKIKPDVRTAALIMINRTTAKKVNEDHAHHERYPLLRGLD